MRKIQRIKRDKTRGSKKYLLRHSSDLYNSLHIYVCIWTLCSNMSPESWSSYCVNTRRNRYVTFTSWHIIANFSYVTSYLTSLSYFILFQGERQTAKQQWIGTFRPQSPVLTRLLATGMYSTAHEVSYPHAHTDSRSQCIHIHMP